MDIKSQWRRFQIGTLENRGKLKRDTKTKTPGSTGDELKLEIKNFEGNCPGSCIYVYGVFPTSHQSMCYYEKVCNWIALVFNFYQVDETEGQ